MMPGSVIHYTLDGNEPTSKAAIYTQPIKVTKDTQVKAVVFKNGAQVGKVTQKSFFVNKATGKSTSSNVPIDSNPIIPEPRTTASLISVD
jgi:hexosaminidase